jgi:hypothetical protein
MQTNDDTDDPHEGAIDEENTVHRPTEINKICDDSADPVDTMILDVLFRAVDPLVEQKEAFINEGNPSAIESDLRFMNFHNSCYVAAYVQAFLDMPWTDSFSGM